jgi:hypothetical protein
MRSLEWFLIHAENDPRLGTAYVLLAESYLAQKRFVQARAASVEARERGTSDRLTPDWRERALKVWARSALALGEKEKAFQELEQMVVRGEEPELTLFLCRRDARRPAVGAGDRRDAQPMLDLESPIGDRARFKKIHGALRAGVGQQPPRGLPGAGDPAMAPKIARSRPAQSHRDDDRRRLRAARQARTRRGRLPGDPAMSARGVLLVGWCRPAGGESASVAQGRLGDDERRWTWQRHRTREGSRTAVRDRRLNLARSAAAARSRPAGGGRSHGDRTFQRRDR